MYRIEHVVFDVAVIAVALWIVKRFWLCFYEEKKKLGCWYYISVITYCVIQFCFQLHRGQIHFVLSILNVIAIFGIGCFGYESKGKAKYLRVIFLYGIWSLMEVLTLFLAGMMPLGERAVGVIGVVVSQILMMGIVYWMSIMHIKKREGMLPNKIYIWLFFFPFGSSYIAIHEFYTGRKLIFSLIEISILLVFNLVIFEMYLKMNEFFFQQREQDLYAQQMELIAANTVEQKRMLEEFHEQKHNLVNELVVIKDLVSHGQDQEATQSIDELLDGRTYEERVANTGNSTVDAIINFKYIHAKEYGITFALKAFIPQELPISQNDIGVVLGNALDNAIEATKVCRCHEKKIEISMGVKKEAWVIVIRNPYENELKKNRSGKLVTSKKDESRHGYGLKSIQKITDNYQGDMIIDTDDAFFTLTLVLNFGEI